MLVSSTENSPLIRALGTPSRRPEQFGVDLLARIPSESVGGRFLGIQRKAIPDLIASLYDGRLSMERSQWNRLLDLGGIIILVIEGRLTFTNDGALMGVHGKPFMRWQLRRLVHSVNRQGVSVQFTDSPKDTAELVTDLVDYHSARRTGSRKSGRPGPKPSGKLGQKKRPGESRGRWGTPSSRDWLIHAITSFEGVGATTAEAILDANNGTLPLQWTVTKDWLRGIKGVGEKRAESLWKALQPQLQVIEGEQKASKHEPKQGKPKSKPKPSMSRTKKKG